MLIVHFSAIRNLHVVHHVMLQVMAIEHADFDGIERLAFVLGADIVSTFDTPEVSSSINSSFNLHNFPAIYSICRVFAWAPAL
jgi:hypothetical protein